MGVLKSVRLHRGSRDLEVTWVGTHVEVCDDDDIQLLDFLSARDASEFARDLITRRRASGFEDGEAPEPPAPVVPDLSSEEGRLVWGDHLQQEGAVLGEIIALQAAGLSERAHRLIRRHGPQLLGLGGSFPELLDLEWSLGMIVSARVHVLSVCDVGELLADLLESPCSRRLTFLEILAPFEGDLEALLPVIVAQRPKLEVLHLRGWEELDLTAVLEAVPTLIELGISTDLEVEVDAAHLRVVELSQTWVQPTLDDAPDVEEEEGASGDVLDIGSRWRSEQAWRIVSYVEDPGAEQEDPMPAMGGWTDRGEPTRRPYDEDGW